MNSPNRRIARFAVCFLARGNAQPIARLITSSTATKRHTLSAALDDAENPSHRAVIVRVAYLHRMLLSTKALVLCPAALPGGT